MNDIITAREFLLNTYDTSFLSDDERETIITALELFAKGKCKEQREECNKQWCNMPEWDDDTTAGRLKRAEKYILNAPEPKY